MTSGSMITSGVAIFRYVRDMRALPVASYDLLLILQFPGSHPGCTGIARRRVPLERFDITRVRGYVAYESLLLDLGRIGGERGELL